MTEHLEIASYRMLIVLAEMAGRPELCPALEASLREEEAMADWFNQNLEQLTRRFVELEAAEDRQADAVVPVAHSGAPLSAANPSPTGSAMDRGMGRSPVSGKGLSDV